MDKDYLDKLKKEDYMAWDDLVNDPMVVGQNTEGDFIVLFVVLILLVILGIILIAFEGIF